PPIARGRLSVGERGIDDVRVACAVAESVPREGIGAADGEPLLERQRVAADPAPGQYAQVHAPRRAHARVAPEVEEQTVELVGPVRGNRTAYRARHAGLGFDVVGA